MDSYARFQKGYHTFQEWNEPFQRPVSQDICGKGTIESSTICFGCGQPHECYAMYQIGYLLRAQSAYISLTQILNHCTAVRCVLEYLRRTRDHMLSVSSDVLIPVGYITSDFWSDKDSRKSTSGYVPMLQLLEKQLGKQFGSKDSLWNLEWYFWQDSHSQFTVITVGQSLRPKNP